MTMHAPHGDLKKVTGELFNSCDALVFVGACGIAVRAVAPYVTAKTSDPRSIILPALTLGIGEAAWLARLVRSAILDEMNKSYQWTARAKGAAERTVLWRHVLRNSLIPIITAVGLQFVYLMAGSVLVESIFARQGIGRLALTAIQNRDFPLVQGTVTLISVIYVIVNTVTDILYALVDPRVRL